MRATVRCADRIRQKLTTWTLSVVSHAEPIASDSYPSKSVALALG